MLAAGDFWHGAFALKRGKSTDEKYATRFAATRFANGATAMKFMNFGGSASCPDGRTLNAFL